MRYALLLLVAGATVPGIPASVSQRPRVPYTFERNVGQAPAEVRYLARGQGYGLFLTERDAILTLAHGSEPSQVVRMSLVGSSAPAAIEGIEPAAQSINYFTGNDPSQWKTNVPAFHRVRFSGVYPGVDLVYHNGDGNLEYDFMVAPHTSADAIQLRFDGMQHLRITAAGALELSFGARKLTQQAPVAYQISGSKRLAVEAAYLRLGSNRVGFRLGPHNPNLPVVIDPVVIYSTYLGGDLSDTVNAIAVDSRGNTYVTGETTSGNFPIVGGSITSVQGAVVYSFITKYNAAGTAILYSTFLGGASNTRGYAIAVDDSGNAFVGGVTGAHNFPLVNPVQTTPPGLNLAYVAKLNPQGNGLLFSTYLGGDRNDEVRGLALDSRGNIHVTGRVTSSNFPTVNAIQPVFGGSSDGFVAMYGAPNYRLVYSTFLGGAPTEEANALVLDSAGNTYITGISQGPGMATVGAYQSITRGSYDAFVAKINAAGTKLEWYTYYGGRNDEKGAAIAVDSDGNVLVGGYTTSDNLPVTGSAIQAGLRGDSDAFLAKFSPDGKDLLYATYMGSTSRGSSTLETIEAIGVDARGAVTVAGLSNGADFPTLRPIQSYGGGHSDGFVARFSPTLGSLEFSTNIGGSNDDNLLAMALDAGGGVHIAGDTLSGNFPLKNPLRTTFAGAREGFVSHICDPLLAASATSLSFSYQAGQALPAAQTVQISACAPIPFQVQAQGSFLTVTPLGGVTNGTLTVTVQPQNLQTGTYNGEIKVSAADSINSPITIPVVLRVGVPPVFTQAGVAHAASELRGAVSPGELIVIYGSNLGPQSLATAALDTQGRIAATLQETRVYFDGFPAPLVYVWDKQVSAVVPYEVAGKASTQIQVEYRGLLSAPVTMAVTQAQPGFFTADSSGTGQGAILNQDYSLNGASNPAARGSIVIVYGTGEGQTTPNGATGTVTGSEPPLPAAPVSVSIGGKQAQVLYAGSAPGMVAGVFQLNVTVPDGIPAGNAEIRVTVGTAVSPAGVTVAVK